MSVTSTWVCRACATGSQRPYRYPSSPSEYCCVCDAAMDPTERLATAIEAARTDFGASRPASPSLPAPTDDLMTVEEAAAHLKLTPRGVYARAARGQLPGVVKIGRSLRFRRSALVGAFAEGRAPSPKGVR